MITNDRSGWSRDSTDTLDHKLAEEMTVVSLIIFPFVLHTRNTLVPITTLPLAALLSFIPMFLPGLTANIMSLGGIVLTAVGAGRVR